MGDEAEELLKHRFAIINLWRPIRGPLLESPLTLCDAQSLAEENLIASDLKYPDRTGETYSITYNPNQRYYYFPEMQADEAVLIRCFDSALQGPRWFSAHTGFDDPNSPAAAPPRESIEVRTLVFSRREADGPTSPASLRSAPSPALRERDGAHRVNAMGRVRDSGRRSAAPATARR